MKLEGGRTMSGFFGVFVEMSPLNEDYQRLKSRVTPLKFQEFVPRTSSLLNIQAYSAEMNAEEP
jgi:hypothetical protein